jgi:hypothetical protein
MAAPAVALALVGVSCASVLGVDHEYVYLEGGAVADEASGDGGATVGIRCGDGGVFCDPSSTECCLASNNTLSCVSAGGTACATGSDILCDDPADCTGGSTCCLQLDTQNDFLATACMASCPANGTRSVWLALCSPGQSSCATGTCSPLTALQPSPPFTSGWFYTCQ